MKSNLTFSQINLIRSNRWYPVAKESVFRISQCFGWAKFLHITCEGSFSGSQQYKIKVSPSSFAVCIRKVFWFIVGFFSFIYCSIQGFVFALKGWSLNFYSPTRPNPGGGGETCAETAINVFFGKVDILFICYRLFFSIRRFDFLLFRVLT